VGQDSGFHHRKLIVDHFKKEENEMPLKIAPGSSEEFFIVGVPGKTKGQILKITADSPDVVITLDEMPLPTSVAFEIASGRTIPSGTPSHVSGKISVKRAVVPGVTDPNEAQIRRDGQAAAAKKQRGETLSPEEERVLAAYQQLPSPGALKPPVKPAERYPNDYDSQSAESKQAFRNSLKSSLGREPSEEELRQKWMQDNPPLVPAKRVVVTAFVTNAAGAPVLDEFDVAVPNMVDTVTIVPDLQKTEGVLFGTPTLASHMNED
jgi:hypothetical protein